MSTTIIFNDLTPVQIETVKAFAHAVKNQSPIDVEFYVGNNEWKSKPIEQFFSIHSKYRIKPQPKIVPFTIDDSEKLIGKTVKAKDRRTLKIISTVNDDGLQVGVSWCSYRELLNDCTFLDGSPCGKKE